MVVESPASLGDKTDHLNINNAGEMQHFFGKRKYNYNERNVDKISVRMLQNVY